MPPGGRVDTRLPLGWGLQRETCRENGPMNRSADWLHQARSDLELAGVSAAAGHHEWACFACHQAVEKALKGLHLHLGQQAWGTAWAAAGVICRQRPPASWPKR